jgi:hypothetical protein
VYAIITIIFNQTNIMKKIVLFLFSALVAGMAMAQPPRPPRPPQVLPAGKGDKREPIQELHAQGEHVKSSGNDLLHLRFRQAHEKHVAEARRRNRGIARDLGVSTEPPLSPNGRKAIRRPH